MVPRFRAVGLILACVALCSLPLSPSLGQPGQENPFEKFQVGWEDKCSVVDDDSYCAFKIQITGLIAPGIVSRFEKALAHAQGRQRLLISLSSQGGDLTSAMRIGRMVRNARGRTVVEKDALCASACVLIFAAGLSRVVPPVSSPVDPSNLFADLVSKHTVIGIHRPALAGMPRQNEMSEVKAAADQYERDLRQYAAEMNISPRLIDDMLSIPPEQIHWVSSEDELQNYGLGFLDPVYAETISITEAKKYKISPAEYRSRNTKALSACRKLLNDDDRYGFLESPRRSQCVVDIISGKLTPPRLAS